MSRDDVERNQRARLYGAMIEAVHERGYPQTTVAHVIALAGVSRRAFYEQFDNKEECFLATYDIVVARARKVVLEAWARERGWANRPARRVQGAARRRGQLAEGAAAGARRVARRGAQGARADDARVEHLRARLRGGPSRRTRTAKRCLR